MKYKYKSGALGGTFDHLHLGHKDLINTAFALSEKVTIGLTTENVYYRKFLSQLIEPYEIRENTLKAYLKEKKYLSRARIVRLEDIYGPTVGPEEFNAIFATQATLPNAKAVNEERGKKELPQLDIVTVPFKKDEDGGVMTSERIRIGEIDREGHVYMNIFKEKNSLKLPADLRKEMRHQIGKAVKDIHKISKPQSPSLLISVGDIVSKSFHEIDRIPDIEIIDFRTRRSEIDKKALKKYREFSGRPLYKNAPATIQKDVVLVFKDAVEEFLAKPVPITLGVDGEEDLLALPAILLAPFGSIVCYGHFDLNAVIEIEVTEESKKAILQLLQQFV